MSTPYTAFPNRLRQQLKAGERLIGCWLSLGSPISTEVVGVAGFDWLLLDAEHAPNDVLSLIPQLMALKDSPSAPVVRPPWNDTVLIKRLLDAGCYNFLIPFVETAAQARAAVAATRYPPHGVRGVSVSQRGNRYGSVPRLLRAGERTDRVGGADRKPRRRGRGRRDRGGGRARRAVHRPVGPGRGLRPSGQPGACRSAAGRSSRCITRARARRQGHRHPGDRWRPTRGATWTWA